MIREIEAKKWDDWICPECVCWNGQAHCLHAQYNLPSCIAVSKCDLFETIDDMLEGLAEELKNPTDED